jgi:hypothetical protein
MVESGVETKGVERATEALCLAAERPVRWAASEPLTLFEFLTIAVSIVLALGLVRLVDGLGIASNAATRYWVHLLAVGLMIVTHLYYWWSLWLFRDGVSWNFGYFVFIVLGALLLNFSASSLIPRETGTMDSWKSHYFGVHRRFFLVNAAWVTHQILALPVLRNQAVPADVLAGGVVGVGLNLAGAFSKSERVHRFLMISVGAFILAFAANWSQPPVY